MFCYQPVCNLPIPSLTMVDNSLKPQTLATSTPAENARLIMACPTSDRTGQHLNLSYSLFYRCMC